MYFNLDIKTKSGNINQTVRKMSKVTEVNLLMYIKLYLPGGNEIIITEYKQ